MTDILKLVESLSSGSGGPDGKSPLGHLGFISCGRSVHIRHVAFYEPCFIMVLAGSKTLYVGQQTIQCETGCSLTVPGPASFDLRNQPHPRSAKYRALVIPFKHEHLEELQKSHAFDYTARREHIGILKFSEDAVLSEAVKHYLQSPNEPRLVKHRVMEILLNLAMKNPQLLSYVLNQQSWSQRVRSILATDLAREWNISEICAQLATSESSLRRHLQRESTGFRDLLFDLRLNTALMQLLQTSQPVYQVAYDCGYQSVSRFTSNFRKRFGLPPTEFRASVDEKGQALAESDHPRPH